MADQRQAYAKVVARAWRDEEFKARLLGDPAATLREAGVEVPGDVTVTMVEDSDTEVHLVLPPAPDGDLDEEALDQVVGGQQKSQSLGCSGCIFCLCA